MSSTESRAKWNNSNILTFSPARNSWGVMRMTLSCHIYCFILKRKEITSMDLMLCVAYMEQRLIYYLLRVPEAKVNPSFSKIYLPLIFYFSISFLVSVLSKLMNFICHKKMVQNDVFLPPPACLSVSSAFQKAPKNLSCWLDSKMTTKRSIFCPQVWHIFLIFTDLCWNFTSSHTSFNFYLFERILCYGSTTWA